MAGELSWQRYAHGITYFYGAVALLLSVFAMAWRFHGDERCGATSATNRAATTAWPSASPYRPPASGSWS